MSAAGRQDIIEGERERGAWLSTGGNAQSKAVITQGERHAWACQSWKFEVMSKGIKSGIEDENLLVGRSIEEIFELAKRVVNLLI
jgi:hypothetical protein